MYYDRSGVSVNEWRLSVTIVLLADTQTSPDILSCLGRSTVLQSFCCLRTEKHPHHENDLFRDGGFDAIINLHNNDSVGPSLDHLFHEDGVPQREHALKAAEDGVITYSYTSENFKWIEPKSFKRWTVSGVTTDSPVPADAEQSRWIEKIFGYLDSITGVSFRKAKGERGELHYNFVPTNVNRFFSGDFADGGSEIDVVENTEFDGGTDFINGYGQMFSVHNRKQYGGLQDIRSIETAILGSLGFTAPGGDAFDLSHDWDNTLMSGNDGGLDSFGATFFFAKDDIEALKKLLGSAPLGERGPRKIVHSQKFKEELMIGTEGVKDVFKLTSKGMILKEDQGTQFDDIGVIINNYYMPYISNFNPYEGDSIKIHRSLLHPKSPQLKSSKKRAKRYKGVELKFKQIFGDTYNEDKNVYYNDAGKIYIDTNGTRKGLITDGNNAGLNSQCIAFVDPVGPETDRFLGEWLSFFG